MNKKLNGFNNGRDASSGVGGKDWSLFKLPYEIEQFSLEELSNQKIFIGDIYMEVDEFFNSTGNQIIYTSKGFEKMGDFEYSDLKFAFYAHSIEEK